MAKKGIEEMISEIEIFIDNCKYQPLSSSKIVVPKDDLEQMLNIRANEILDMARSQADQIVNEANADANEIRLGSMYYTKDKLTEVSNYINATLEAEKANYDNLIQSLQSNLDIVLNNTNEINGDIANMTGATQQAEAPEDDTQAVQEEKVTAEEDRNYNVYGKTEYSDDEEDDEDDDFDDDFLDD